MIEVVGVRFKRAGKIYYFDPQQIGVKLYDDVIVETIRGLEFGRVELIKSIDDIKLEQNLKPVVRLATDEDKSINIDNRNRAREAIIICEREIEKHKLDMRLLSCEYTFDNSKLLFYFTAEGRIDFRELVRDLAAIFKTRIELRQIGVRDEAKLIGGLGCCGRPTCCSTFLTEFTPVSINMAKDQSLSLNPSKISGICGRLMCCLKYEQDGYECAMKKMPRVGEIVKTDVGNATVIDTYTIQELIKVSYEEDDEIKIAYYEASEVKRSFKFDKSFKNEDKNKEEYDESELKELEEQ